MNTVNIASINKRIGALCLCTLAAFLCSCTATSVKKTWKSPDFRQPVAKIAVITIEERGSLRRGFENRFVTQLTKAGTAAVVTYDQLSLPDIKKDKRAAADRFVASGADAVLILRLLDISASYRDVQPGGERYAGTVTGFETMGWYDYYSMGFMNMSPTYGSLTQRLYLETSLYDLKTEKRVWSGVTQTVIKETMDRVAEMDPLVEKIVAAMRKDSVIR
jgi:hypothetical protein